MGSCNSVHNCDDRTVAIKTPISDVMTRNVHTLHVGAKLSEVRQALISNDFHHMPIVDGDRLVGMISWRDLVHAYRAAMEADELNPLGVGDALDHSASVEDVMTRKLVTARDDDPLDHAIDLIADGHVHSVLVLDSDERLAGIITDKNIVEFFSS